MHTGYRAGISAAAVAMVFCAASAAQAQAVRIDIEPQPLGSALNRVAVQSQSQILFRPEMVAGRTARKVSGSMTVEAALNQLLQDTGLKYRHQNNVILIERPEGVSRISDSRPPVQLAQAAAVEEASASLGEPVDRGSSQLSEIIVTAQKREESLQGTPISIAVLGSEDLARRGVATLSDFASGAVPSLRIIPIQARPSSLTVTMRGIYPGDAAMISRDPTVGIYVDGVYLGRSQGLGSEMFDLERMEVLRGPQGTLFGRNAVGGAISMVSKKPTGRLGLDLTAGISNFDGRSVKAHLNLPEFAGFSIKLDGVWTKRDGWVENALAGASDWYEVNRRGARVSVMWEPGPDLNVLYSYDISRDASTAGYNQTMSVLPGGLLPPMFSLEKKRVREGQIGVPMEPSVGKVSGHSLQATWNVTDQLTLRSISAYRKLSQDQYTNSGGLTLSYAPNSVFSRISYADMHQDQFSQEVQLLGSFENLKFVAGAFYFKEDADDLAYSPFSARFNSDGTGYTLLPVSFSAANFPERASVLHAKSRAVFGQATYTPPILGERLHLTGGLRWTHDSKHGARTRAAGAVIDIPFSFSSKRVDPAFTAAFDWTDAINTYVKWGQAYRAGGANSRAPNFEKFGEEEVSSWEIGAKTELFNRRVRLNIAAYHTKYKDRQVDFVNPRSPSVITTVNTPDPAKIKGVEVDLTARLTRELTLTGSYAYTSWKAVGDRNPYSGLIEEGVVLYTPRNSASAALDHVFSPFDGATLSTHVDAIYSSSFYTGSATTPRTDSYVMLNGRITLGDLEIGNGPKLAVSLWGKNLTNTQWETFQYALAGTGVANVVSGYFNEPRTYGVEARLTF